MGNDEIITLEDGTEYILLLSTQRDDSKYFLASKYENDAPTDSYEVFKEVMVGNDYAVEAVTDEELKNSLTEEFENQVDNMEDNESEI